MALASPRMRYGWKPDREHRLGTAGLVSARRLLGGAGPPPPVADWSHLVTEVHDQGPMECCVGMALARAIHMRAQVQGISIPYPSELAVYTNGRAWPLVDEGCYPRDAMAALGVHGIVTSERWPLDPSKVNTPLPWDAYQHGLDALDIRYYRIDGTGDERILQLRQALAHGYIPIFGQQIDHVFADYKTGVIGPWGGPSLGGHATTLIGYAPPGDSTGMAFRGVNSWGTSWGKDGLYWMSEARLADPAVCDDFYVVTLAPTAVS